MLNAAQLPPAIIARYYIITEGEFPAGPEIHLGPPEAVLRINNFINHLEELLADMFQ